jgi:hypothetical protein
MGNTAGMSGQGMGAHHADSTLSYDGVQGCCGDYSRAFAASTLGIHFESPARLREYKMIIIC